MQLKEHKKYIKISVRDKAESQYWMAMIVRPSGGTALKTDTDSVGKKHSMGSGTLLKATVCEHSLSLHLKMKFKTLSCKEETMNLNMTQKCCCLFKKFFT